MRGGGAGFAWGELSQMQGHRESIILGKNLNTGETEGVLVGLHPFIHDSSIKKFWVAHCLGIETGNRIGGKSMRVRCVQPFSVPAVHSR